MSIMVQIYFLKSRRRVINQKIKNSVLDILESVIGSKH